MDSKKGVHLEERIIKVAFIGNVMLLLWLMWDIFKWGVPHVLNIAQPQQVVSIWMALIMLGMLFNVISLVVFVRNLAVKKSLTLPDRNILIFNLVILILTLLYYLIAD